MRWSTLLIVPVVALTLATPAMADDNAYLRAIRSDYFARNFTDAQLLAEGHKVCDMNAKATDEQLFSMVASDLGVATSAAASLVGIARGGLGC